MGDHPLLRLFPRKGGMRSLRILGEREGKACLCLPRLGYVSRPEMESRALLLPWLCSV